MCFNHKGHNSTLNGSSLKLVDKFTDLRSSVSSTKKDINTGLAKAWTVIDRLSVIRKSGLTDKIKRSFLQAAVVSILLIWMHYMDANKTYGEKVWWQLHKNAASNIEQFLVATPYKTAAMRPPTTHHENYLSWRTRHAGHSWRNKDELMWTPSHGRVEAGRPARTYIQQLCTDTGCDLEDLLGAMDDRDGWRARVREICTGSGTCWWWWKTTLLQINIIICLITFLSLSLSFALSDPSRQWNTPKAPQKCKTPTNECPWYYIKQFDSESTTLKIWGMWRTSSLPSLPRALCFGVVGAYLYVK